MIWAVSVEEAQSALSGQFTSSDFEVADVTDLAESTAPWLVLP
jgi:hypothetical protein